MVRPPLIDVGALRQRYLDERPDPAIAGQRVAFGTSGHRGSAERQSFNEAHILAVAQAVAEHRAAAGIDGPLYLGMDTHALSAPAHATVLEVMVAHGVTVRHAGEVPTATPVVSHAILAHNAGRGGRGLADGLIVTPSHNPPEDGGIKYNPPSGGPADEATTAAIEARANQLLADVGAIRRVPISRALAESSLFDFTTPYVDDLLSVVDLEAVRAAGLRIGADPMGGASLPVWTALAERGLGIAVVNPVIDPTFAFMPPDHDGKIRMDCSSPAAMANLIALRDRYDVASGNDADADRHGIVTPTAGLMNPNHFLAAAIRYLFSTREWPGAAVGKTLVSSSIIDRVTAALGRRLHEVPVGFKWFVDGLVDGSLGFGGEESAGASFLRKDGRPWTTDKDGIVMALLASEMRAVTGKDPGEHYREIERDFGSPRYVRQDVAATPAEKARLKRLSPADVRSTELAGEPIVARMTTAPGNGAAIGGLKVTTANGWFAARPSGTEDIYKIYAESFLGEAHLDRLVEDARGVVAAALAG